MVRFSLYSTGVGLCLLLSDSQLVSYGAYPASICGGGDFQVQAFLYGDVLIFCLELPDSCIDCIAGCLYRGILHYDTLNNVSLNFPSLLGVGLGALASWLVLARLRTGYKMATFIGFVLVVSYLIIMYF